MSALGSSAGWGLAVAASLLAGAVAADKLQVPERTAAAITTFGGGILLAAVALELVPEADALAGSALTALGIVAGALFYVGIDAWLTRDRHAAAMRRSGHAAAAGRQMPMMSMVTEDPEAARGKSIAAGLFIDGIPESLALGLTIARGGLGAALLAGVLVGNLAEAYGAAQPMIAAGSSKRYATGLLGGIGLSLAVATVAGGTVLAGAGGALVGGAQAVAAGAVLAVISISVIPYAFSRVSGLVALVAAAGFVCGYLLS